MKRACPINQAKHENISMRVSSETKNYSLLRMKKLFLFILILFTFSTISKAQKSEFGIFAGGSYYLGDLNPGKHFLITKGAGGFIYRYNLNPRFSFKLNGFYGTLEGSDAVSGADLNRNLSFKSPLTEFAGEMELNFFNYRTGNKKMLLSPYIFAGISIFHFNPKAEIGGKWYDLHRMGTEGQGTSLNVKPYSLTTLGLPFGIGVKYSLTEKICFGFEWGLRKTGTDYIDDVSTTYADPTILAAENGPIAPLLADRSLNQTTNHTDLQRGNSVTKDWYSFTGIFLTISLKKKERCGSYNETKKFKEYFKN